MTFHVKFVSVFTAMVLTLALVCSTSDRFSLRSFTPIQLIAEEPPSLKPAAKKPSGVQQVSQDSDYSFFETLLDPKLQKYVGLKGKVEVFSKRKTEKIKPSGREDEWVLVGSPFGVIKQNATPNIANIEVQKKELDPVLDSFLVQVASFKNRIHARSLVKKMKAKGYDAFLKKNETKSGLSWYRVYLGRFREKNKAIEIARKVRLSERVEPIVVLQRY